jgi:3-mercaptopyruvate sulfurtransferase SseA
MAVARITKEDLKTKLDGSEADRPALVDARLKYPWEHSSMKLPGAVRVAPTAVSAAGLPKDRDIVVYDSDPDEITAVRVAAELAGAGLKVRVLKGGLPDWVAGNLPVDTKDAVRPAVPPPAAAPAAKA